MENQIYTVTCKAWNVEAMKYEYLCFDVTYDARQSMDVADEAEHAFEKAITERTLVYVH